MALTERSSDPASDVERDGPTLIAADRYTSAAWMALENERLWPRVWQVACSVDHVAEPGDFYEYRAGWLSVVIVRSDDGALRAFQNVCRHRGNTICQGTGTGLTELRCPFHRWAWTMDGCLREVPNRKAFGLLYTEDFSLFPVQVATWGRLVFVNLDTDAMTLADWLEGIPDDLSWCPVDDYRCDALVTSPVPANWKVIADGFSETYHVQGIHRELLGHMDDVNAPQKLWRRHGVSYQHYGVPSPRLGRNTPPETVWDTWMHNMGSRLGLAADTPMPAIPAGRTVQEAIADGIVAYQAQQGVDVSNYDLARLTGMSQYNLFPNTTLLAMPDMIIVLCGRPGLTPDDAHLVMLQLHRVNPGTPRSQPFTGELPADTDLGLVTNQDVAIMQTMQRGLHQPGFRHVAASAEECRLINLHRNLDEWVGSAGPM